MSLLENDKAGPFRRRFARKLMDAYDAAVNQHADLVRERDELRLNLECEKAVRSMTVDRLEGMVEGQPTHKGNFLQRIDELREIEKASDSWGSDSAAICTGARHPPQAGGRPAGGAGGTHAGEHARDYLQQRRHVQLRCTHGCRCCVRQGPRAAGRGRKYKMTNTIILLGIVSILIAAAVCLSYYLNTRPSPRTIYAKSLKREDVQEALNQAYAGDIVVLPRGQEHWFGEGVIIPPGVTLQAEWVVHEDE